MIVYTKTCDFGSGARLEIAQNSAHAVIGIKEGGYSTQLTIALTPASMRELARKLVETAEDIEEVK